MSAALNREPHAAFRKNVETNGDDAPRALYELFDEYNRVHFEGKLGAPMIWISTPSSPRALGDYCGQDVHGIESRIRIAPKTIKRGGQKTADVLLHEMVHAWMGEIVGDLEPGYKGHGPKFAAKCNEIGKKIGVPEVFARPRGKDKGRLDCAHWPHRQEDEEEETLPTTSANLKVKLDDDERAAIDAAAGGLDAAEWARKVLLEAAGR